MIRLKILRQRHGWTQAEMAVKLNVAQTTYSSWEKERTQMDYETLKRVAVLFNVTVDYLLGRAKKRSEEHVKAVPVPVYGDIGLDKSKSIPDLIGFEYISKNKAQSNKYFGLKILDDSFAPRILKGDTIIVRKQHICKSGDIVIINTDNQWITIKKINKYKEGIMLSDFNVNLKPEFITRWDIIERKVRIIGKVVELRGML